MSNNHIKILPFFWVALVAVSLILLGIPAQAQMYPPLSAEREAEVTALLEEFLPPGVILSEATDEQIETAIVQALSRRTIPEDEIVIYVCYKLPPHLVEMAVSAAISAYPQSAVGIVAAAVKTSPEMATIIVSTAIKIVPEKTTDFVEVAVFESNEIIAVHIVSAAVSLQPEKKDAILSAAISSIMSESSRQMIVDAANDAYEESTGGESTDNTADTDTGSSEIEWPPTINKEDEPVSPVKP